MGVPVLCYNLIMKEEVIDDVNVGLGRMNLRSCDDMMNGKNKVGTAGRQVGMIGFDGANAFNSIE